MLINSGSFWLGLKFTENCMINQGISKQQTFNILCTDDNN